MNRSFGFISIILLSALFGATAQAAGPFTPDAKHIFDWKKVWGDVKIGSDDDVLIPAKNHVIKLSLKNTIDYCLGENASVDDIKVYAKDMNGDGVDDYIVDTNDLEGKISADCSETLCTAKDGCFVVAYVTGPVSQIIAKPATNADACPVTAAANTACRADCLATAQQCPQLFNYDFKISYTKRVKSWDLYAAEQFPAGEGTIASPYLKDGNNPVMSFEQADKDCYGQEIQFNSGKCIKYVQWKGAYADGFLRDIYRVYTPPVTADNGLKFTTEAFNSEKATSDFRGKKIGDGFGITISKAGSGNDFFALQMPNFETTGTGDKKKAFMCFELRNTSKYDLFIPTNSDEEIRAFVNNPPEGITIQACSLRFTDWSGGPFLFNDKKTGVLDCGQLSGLPCHAEQEIFAERFCERSSTALTTGDECVNGLELAEITSTTIIEGEDKGTYGRKPVVDEHVYKDTKKKIKTETKTKSVHLRSDPAIDDTIVKQSKYRGAIASYIFYDAYILALKEHDKALYNKFMDTANANKGNLGNGSMNGFIASTMAHENGAISQAARNVIFAQRVKVIYEESSACQKRAVCHISTNCTHGASCMPSKVKILMADGSEKSMGDIKVGDMVMSFKADDLLGKLVPGKVGAIKVTDDQTILGLNDTDLTPNHPVVLSTGQVVLASTIGRNDQLIDKDGKKIDMLKVTRHKEPTTVFNLEIEGMDGFVANGVRVMDESIQSNMSVKK